MAVPKKRTSSSKKRMRSSGDFLKSPIYHLDSNGNPVLPHRIDSNGMYKGMQLIVKKVKKKETEETAE
jgi:ribosomal protein L32